MEQHTPWHFANASVEPQDAKIIYYSPSCAPIEEKRSQACDETLKFLDLSESTLEWKAVLHEASYIYWKSTVHVLCLAISGNKTYLRLDLKSPLKSISAHPMLRRRMKYMLFQHLYLWCVFFCFLLSLKTTHFMITLCLPFQVGMIEGLTSFTAMFSGQEGGNERWTRMEDVFPKGTWGFSIASLPAMLVYQRARSTMNRARWVVDFRCSQLIPTGRCRKIAVPCRDRCSGLGNLGSLWPLGKNILPPKPERMSPVQRDHFYRKWIIF